MKENPSVYVGSIGKKNVTIGGGDCLSFCARKHQLRRGVVVNYFDDEEDLYAFLQGAIDKGWPFSDAINSNAFRQACYLLNQGKIHGDLLPVTWE